MKCKINILNLALMASGILFSMNVAMAQPEMDKLPEKFNGYRLSDYVGKVDENELYTSYLFSYQKEGSQKKQDYIKINIRIYHDMQVYKQEVESFSMEDAYMTMSSINLEDLNDQESLMGQLTKAMKNPDETPENVSRSDEETLEDLDVKDLDIPGYSSGHYRLAPDPSGNDYFRAVITWGADRYATVHVTAGKGEKLDLERVLAFIRSFPFREY